MSHNNFYAWEGYGLVLDIEKESSPAHLQECHICIKALTPSSVQDYIPYDVSLCRRSTGFSVNLLAALQKPLQCKCNTVPKPRINQDFVY